MKGFIIIFCVISAAYGQVQLPSIQNGSCPKVEPMQNLNVSKLVGKFWGCEESSSNFPEFNKCTSLILEPNGPNGWSSIFSGISSRTHFRQSVTATVTIDNQKNVTVFYNSLSEGPLSINLYVMDTDYEYVIYWSCMNDKPQQTPGLWLLAKDPNRCPDYKEKLLMIMQQIGVNMTMNSVSQNNC